MNLVQASSQRVCLTAVILIGFLLGDIGRTPRPVFGEESQPATYQSLVTAFHVHSTWSTGTLTLHQLAERSKRFGIDAGRG